MLGYLSAVIICSEKRTVHSGKTVSFEGQIMSKEKYSVSKHTYPRRLLCF